MPTSPADNRGSEAINRQFPHLPWNCKTIEFLHDLHHLGFMDLEDPTPPGTWAFAASIKFPASLSIAECQPHYSPLCILDKIFLVSSQYTSVHTCVQRRFYMEQTSIHSAWEDATPKPLQESQQRLFQMRFEIFIKKRKSIFQIPNPEDLLMTLNGHLGKKNKKNGKVIGLILVFNTW